MQRGIDYILILMGGSVCRLRYSLKYECFVSEPISRFFGLVHVTDGSWHYKKGDWDATTNGSPYTSGFNELTPLPSRENIVREYIARMRLMYPNAEIGLKEN